MGRYSPIVKPFPQGWAGIPIPGHFREYRPPIPVPESRKWNFSLTFSFPKVGNGICHSRSHYREWSIKVGNRTGMELKVGNKRSFTDKIHLFNPWLNALIIETHTPKFFLIALTKALNYCIYLLVESTSDLLVPLSHCVLNEKWDVKVKVRPKWFG